MGQRIAVLGAGPMGLAIAYQLTQEGHSPVIFEADDRIGGMSASFDFGGLQIERYYHFHCITDYDFLQLLNELGIAGKMHWVETKMGYWFDNKLQQWGTPIALLKFSGLGMMAKLRYGLHAFLSTKRNNWNALDLLEATGWIKRWVGDEAYEVLWRRLFEYKFHHYANNLSAAWIWSRIRRIGRSRYDLFREKLGYLEGGTQTLLSAIQKSIESHGGQIRLRAAVEEVVIDGDRVSGIIVGGKIEAFEKVVSTIPLPYIPRLIPGLPREILKRFESIHNIAVVCLIIKLTRPVSINFWVNTNDRDMDIPGLVEYSNLRVLPQSIVYIPFYMPGGHVDYTRTDQFFIDKARIYLKKINPDLTDGDFVDIRVNRYRYAQPICDPGYLAKLPPVALPIRGLWVCDTSYYYPEDRGISESIGFGRRLAQDILM